MTEESNYVVDSQGALLVNPSVLDYYNELLNNKIIKNNHLVYLFIDKEVPGIKFYNLNNSYNEGKYLKFVTKKKLITEANWDFLINYPNQSMLFRSDVGNIRIDTYMVSKDKLLKILHDSSKSNNETITILIKYKKKIDLLKK